MGILRQFVFFFDSFSAPAALRVTGNPETSSVCSGLFSLMLLGFFAYIFAIKTFQVLTFQQVTSNSVVEDRIGVQKKGQVMFAMNILEIHGSLVQNKYFQLYAAQLDKQGAIVAQVPLRLCTINDFSGVDQNILKDYYDIEQWYCPNTPLNITGVKSDTSFTYVNLKMDYCLTETWCQTLPNIVSFIQSNKIYQGYLTAEFIIQDTSFTLVQEHPSVSTIKYYKGTFTEAAGTVLDIDLAEYVIQTDTSTFPWNEPKNQTGLYVYQKQHFFSEYDSDYNYLIEANIKFQSKTMKVSRAFGKIDDMLSYAGGLFSIIVGFFAFFLASYNQYKYQLKMAEGCFNLDEHGNKVKSENFHFFTYIGYVLFDWIKTLTCYEIKCCTNMKKIDQTREEAIEQMDIFFLYKKIQYLENMCKYLMTQNQAVCLCVTQPPFLDQVKSKRLFIQYYDEVTQGESSVTLEDIYPPHDTAVNLSDQQKKNALKNLGLKELTEIVMNYKSLNVEEFQKIETQTLSDEMNQTERQLANAFYELQGEQRGMIQGRYPLIILYCLIRSKQMNENRQNTVNMETNSQINKSASNFFGRKLVKVQPLDSSLEQVKLGMNTPKR